MNQQKDNDICISGIGLVSVFGDSLNDFSIGMTQETSKITYLSDKKILKDYRIPIYKTSIETELKSPEERLFLMGNKAIQNALKDYKFEMIPKTDRICLIVGCGMGLVDQYYFDSNKSNEQQYFCTLAEKLSQITGLNCESVYIGNACAAGSQAISYGMDLLKSERYDLVIAGGIDILSQAAYAGFLRLNAIDLDKCRPFDKNRKGIAVGEGAVFYVLERRESVKPCSNIYCTLPGAGVTCDAYHIVQMNPDGLQAIRAMDQAISLANFDKKDIDLIVAHGTGTPQNDQIESKIIKQYFKNNHIFVTAPKGAIGHTGGASGAFGVLVAISVLRTGSIPPVFNFKESDQECELSLVTTVLKHEVKLVLVNAFAFGGTNVSILCMKEELDVKE